MTMAINPGDRPVDLLIAAGSVPIPRSHPAYCGASEPPRRADMRRWPTMASTIASLLAIAALSGGAAHYMLRIAEPRGEASRATAAAIPDYPTTAVPAIEGAAPATPAATPGPELSLAADPAAAAPVDAPPAVTIKRPRKPSIKAARLLSLAQKQKPAAALEDEGLAVQPQEDILPAPILLSREPVVPAPKADR